MLQRTIRSEATSRTLGVVQWAVHKHLLAMLPPSATPGCTGADHQNGFSELAIRLESSECTLKMTPHHLALTGTWGRCPSYSSQLPGHESIFSVGGALSAHLAQENEALVDEL
eukprot:6311322-Amphidinium_carterae.1